MSTVEITIQNAGIGDIPLLRQLYYEVYGDRYPLKLGSDPAEMERLINDPYSWYAIAKADGALQGAGLARIDPHAGLATVEGVAVRPQERGSGLGRRLVERLCDQVPPGIHSIYATCRTVSPGPQRMMMANGFRPYGILPNAATVARPETLALFVRHRDGVLDRRDTAGRVLLEELAPLAETVERVAGVPYQNMRRVPWPEYVSLHGTTVEFETVDCAQFVRRRCAERIPKPADRFFPLHEPNLMLVSMDGAIEVYVQHNKAARYAALIGANPTQAVADDALEPVIEALERLGVSYVEALIALSDVGHLSRHLAHGFVPSALYPAMDGKVDYVLLSRTADLLDFRRLAIEPVLRPYLDCYRTIWSQIYFSTDGISS